MVFAGFNVICVLVYRRLEGLRWQDAFFWITHPHSIEYRHIHDSTKSFAFFVCLCVFAFQIWIAERVLVTIFRRQSMEAWKSMIDDISVENVRDHFIVCGRGQVGRTVVDQLRRLEIPLVLIESNEDQYRELPQDGVPVIQGDAKRHDALLTAGIGRARGICIVIDNDADNLFHHSDGPPP